MNLYKLKIDYTIVFTHTPGATNYYSKPVFVLADSSAEAIKKVTDKLLFQPPFCTISDINIKDMEEPQFSDLSTSLACFIK